MAFLPVKGAAFEELAPPDTIMIARARLQSGQHLPQMSHCARCRADAVGLISEGLNEENMERLNRFAGADVLGGRSRPYVAVASEEGALVNQHLGEAARVLIYKKDESTASGFKFHEVRKAPEPGSGEHRWRDLGALLHDCRAFLVSAAEEPVVLHPLGNRQQEQVQLRRARHARSGLRVGRADSRVQFR